jgi:hypothetical protein
VSRLVITGGNHHRLHEELTEAAAIYGMRIQTRRRRHQVARLARLIEPGTIDDSLFDALRTRFQKHTDAVLSAVTSRSKDRLKVLGGTLETRKRREIDDMTQLLDDLAKNHRGELKREEPKQLSLSPRTNARRSARSTRARSATAPHSRGARTRALASRSGTRLVDHTSPVAVNPPGTGVSGLAEPC